MTDDDKFEFYTDILETGSAFIGTRTMEITFSIVDGLSFEVDSPSGKIEELDPKDFEDLQNDVDEINSMDFTEADVDFDNYDGDKNA